MNIHKFIPTTSTSSAAMPTSNPSAERVNVLGVGQAANEMPLTNEASSISLGSHFRDIPLDDTSSTSEEAILEVINKAMQEAGIEDIQYRDGAFHIDAPEGTIIDPMPSLSRSDKVKAWIEKNVLDVSEAPSTPIGKAVRFGQNILRSLYPTFNPIAIFQVKLGSGYNVGTISSDLVGEYNVGGWAQNGVQMNVISRGIKVGEPIVQVFPIHTEFGGAVGNGAVMWVQNLGINFFPGNSPELMFEKVTRVEVGKSGTVQAAHGGSFTDSHGDFAVNSGVGYDSLHHRYWKGKNAIVAGAIMGASSIIGGAAGYILGSAFQTTTEMLTGANDLLSNNTNSTSQANALLEEACTNGATVVGDGTNTAFFGYGNGTNTSHLTCVKGVSDSILKKQNWGHLGFALGSQTASSLAARGMSATTALQPDTVLQLKEVTLNGFDMFVNIPVSDGTTLTVAVLLRPQFTSITADSPSRTNVYANTPLDPNFFTASTSNDDSSSERSDRSDSVITFD